MVAPPSTADPNYVDGSGLSAYDRSLSAHADAQRTLQDMVAARHQRHAQADKIRAEKSASIVRAMSRAVRAQARKLSGTGPSTGASTGAESSQNTSRLGKVSAAGGVRRGRWPLCTWLKGVTAESSFCRDKRVRCAQMLVPPWARKSTKTPRVAGTGSPGSLVNPVDSRQLASSLKRRSKALGIALPPSKVSCHEWVCLLLFVPVPMSRPSHTPIRPCTVIRKPKPALVASGSW